MRGLLSDGFPASISYLANTKRRQPRPGPRPAVELIQHLGWPEDGGKRAHALEQHEVVVALLGDVFRQRQQVAHPARGGGDVEHQHAGGEA